MILKITYKFKDLNICFTETKKLYRLSFISNNKYYPLKEIKLKLHQGKLKYRINMKWYTKEKLNSISFPHYQK